MKNSKQIHWFFLMLIALASCKEENHTDQNKIDKTQIENEFKSIPIVAKTDVLPLYNVPNSITRTIIQDKKGNIWLGGNDGLWRYDGITFKNLTNNFVGYIYEDKKGNIWTSSTSTNGWALSRYDIATIDNEKKTVTEVKSEEGLFFGILEDSDGNIWTGTLNGVYRYDGNTFDDFKR